MNNKQTSHHFISRQQGAALITSLMILLVMTIIGVSALSNTSMEERMSKNFQHTSIAFQAAESAIEKVITSADEGGSGPYANPFYDEDSNPALIAINAGINDTSTVVTENMDPNDYLLNTTLQAQSSVIHRGEKNLCTDYDTDIFACNDFDVITVANIDSSNTRQTHTQTIMIPIPK